MTIDDTIREENRQDKGIFYASQRDDYRYINGVYIDSETAGDIADANYEGDWDRLHRIYENIRNERKYDPWDPNNDPDWGNSGW